MAAWVTHLMIADEVLKAVDRLDRRSFCVGNIAPDCNIESADWKTFTPSREVTHWIKGKRKSFDDCEDFRRKMIVPRTSSDNAEYSFLLGYYSHLLTDAAFQLMIRDEKRVAAAWKRVLADDKLREMAKGMTPDFDSIKKLLPPGVRFHGVTRAEAEYLRKNPGSGYLTEILPLRDFPDYIDYLPHGCIVRKIGIMGYMPDDSVLEHDTVALSDEEFARFVRDTTELVTEKVSKTLTPRDEKNEYVTL